MKNEKLMIMTIFIFLGIIAIGYAVIKPKITLLSISEEKCMNLGDDCWHSFAHQTFNSSYCLKIMDNEVREHCLEHMPKG